MWPGGGWKRFWPAALRKRDSQPVSPARRACSGCSVWVTTRPNMTSAAGRASLRYSIPRRERSASSNLLPRARGHWRGPPTKIKEAVKIFKKKYKKTSVKKGRVWARIKRDERTPEQTLMRVLKDSFIKPRVKSVKL